MVVHDTSGQLLAELQCSIVSVLMMPRLAATLKNLNLMKYLDWVSE